MIEEFRADVTKTRKDGSKGALRIDYGNGREPQEPVRWLWKYIDGAKTAGELYGRALVVIAAEQYASRLVVPQSQRTHADPLVLAQGPGRQGAGQARRRRISRRRCASSRRRSSAPTRSATAPPTRPARRHAAPAALRRPPTTAPRPRPEEATDAEIEVDVEVDVEVEEGDEAEQ